MKSVLVVAAHPDDEVLGCGGTIARWQEEGTAVHVLLLADGESSRSQTCDQTIHASGIENRQHVAYKANAILGAASVELHTLPDNRMDGVELLDIVKLIEASIAKHRPQVVLTHHSGDVNIDHRITHESILAACRPQPGHPVGQLLFFEVPSSTEWRPPGSAQSFTPNIFINISTTLARKQKALQAYALELRDFPHPRSAKAVEALARWRGAIAGVPAAEAFMLGRWII